MATGGIPYQDLYGLHVGGLTAQRQANSNNNNRLGGKATIQYDPPNTSGGRRIVAQDTLIDWTSEDGRPHPITIDVGRVNDGGYDEFPNGYPTPTPPWPPTYVYYRPIATLTHSAGGTFSTTTQFDIGRGQRISLSATSVQLVVSMLPKGSTAPILYPSGYTLSNGIMTVWASLGFFSAPTQSPVIATAYIDCLEHLGTQNAIIPPRATQILPVSMSVISSNFYERTQGLIRLTVSDAQGANLGEYSIANAGQLTPIPLPNDAFRVDVYNTTPEVLGVGQIINVRIPFQLAL